MQAVHLRGRPVPHLRGRTGIRRSVVLAAAQGHGNGGNSHVKVLHLMRHGVTEMNEYLAVHRYDAEDFRDPMLYDTVLTRRGAAGAAAAVGAAAALRPAPELLVVSPLTRALQTAALAFLPHYTGPIAVEPLARERVWHASDIGSSTEELRSRFPDGRYDFSSLPDVWWHCPDPARPREVELEPEGAFKSRVDTLRRWLAARPERCIAVVAHWGLLYELTGGADFENCQIRTFTLSVERQGQQQEESEGDGDRQGQAQAVGLAGDGAGVSGPRAGLGQDGVSTGVAGRIVLRERKADAVPSLLGALFG